MLRSVTALIGLALGLAAASASEADMRILSGQIVVLERMLLPGDTMLIVDVSSESDAPVTGQRRQTGDAQSPFIFEIEAPVDQALVFRAGVRGMDDVLWLSEPLAITPGHTPVDLGPLRAPRIPPMGNAGLLSCGNQLVELGFMPDSLRLRLNEQVITMRPELGSSGEHFVDPDNPATSLQMREDAGLLRIDGAELSECTLIRPDADITQGVWNISAIEDTPSVFPSRTELVFYPDGRLSASVGCNRLIGGYRRHGGIMTFERLASTMMACPEGLQAQEQRFHAILPRVDGYRLDAESGRLLLTSGGQAVLRARR